MSKITAALLAASALAGTFAPSFASAASDSCRSGNSYSSELHSAKVSPFTGTSKMGRYDPYADGMKIGMFDPYTDGLRQVGLSSTPASCLDKDHPQI